MFLLLVSLLCIVPIGAMQESANVQSPLNAVHSATAFDHDTKITQFLHGLKHEQRSQLSDLLHNVHARRLLMKHLRFYRSTEQASTEKEISSQTNSPLTPGSVAGYDAESESGSDSDNESPHSSVSSSLSSELYAVADRYFDRNLPKSPSITKLRLSFSAHLLVSRDDQLQGASPYDTHPEIE